MVVKVFRMVFSALLCGCLVVVYIYTCKVLYYILKLYYNFNCIVLFDI